MIGLLITTILGFFIWSKQEQAKKKIELYEELIKNAEGFYVSMPPDQAEELKREFIRKYRKIFLYASDELIQSINAFLISVHVMTHDPVSDDEKKRLFGNMIINARKDMLCLTDLSISEAIFLFLIPKSIMPRKLSLWVRNRSTILIDQDLMHLKPNS